MTCTQDNVVYSSYQSVLQVLHITLGIVLYQSKVLYFRESIVLQVKYRMPGNELHPPGKVLYFG